MRLSPRAESLVLPVGLVVALVFGLLFPAPGEAVGAVSVGPVDVAVFNVIVIFLISGFNIHGADIDTTGFTRAICWVLAINLVLAPVLVAGVLWLFPIGVAIAFGAAVMGSVPTTLSSAAVTAGAAGGDRAWAAGLTVVSVTVGSLTAPLTVSQLLSADATVPPGPLLLRVVLVVMVPLAVGFAAARLTGHTLGWWWNLVPSIAVIMLLWITVSESAESLAGFALGRLAAVAAIAAFVHFTLLGVSWIVSMRFPWRQGIAVMFVAAQKTLPLALSLVVAVTAVSEGLAPYAAEAVIVCVVWHFLQLVSDSAIAARLARRPRRAVSVPGA